MEHPRDAAAGASTFLSFQALALALSFVLVSEYGNAAHAQQTGWDESRAAAALPSSRQPLLPTHSQSQSPQRGGWLGFGRGSSAQQRPQQRPPRPSGAWAAGSSSGTPSARPAVRDDAWSSRMKSRYGLVDATRPVQDASREGGQLASQGSGISDGSGGSGSGGQGARISQAPSLTAATQRQQLLGTAARR